MAYTPTNWATGDTVTATKLNKLEQGVANAGSAMIVDTNGEYTGNVGEFYYNETLNATFAQIYDALADGTPVYIRRNIETNGYSSDYACCSALYSVLCAFKYNDNYSVVDLTGSPDLEKIAGAYDIPFVRVQNMENIDKVIADFLADDSLALMECIIDPMDLV